MTNARIRATRRQRRFIRYINRLLGLSEEENRRVLASIKTFSDADRYIKNFLGEAKLRSLASKDIQDALLKIAEKLKEEMKS